MIARPANRTIRQWAGAPLHWFDFSGPRRTFASDVGDVADLIGRAPAGIRTGTSWGLSPFGAAVSISRPDKVQLKITPIGPPFTVAAWFRQSSQSSYAPIVVTRDQVGYTGLALGEPFGNPLTGVWSDQGYSSDTGLYVPPTRWVWGAMTVTPDTLTTFLGDEYAGKFASFARPGNYNYVTPSTWYLGYDPGYSGYPVTPTVEIADVRFWDRTLPYGELAREFNDRDWRLKPIRSTFWLDQAPPAQTISPTTIASTLAVGLASLVAGTYPLTPTTVPSTLVVNAPTLAAGSSTVTPSLVASTLAVNPPTLVPGRVTLSPATTPSSLLINGVALIDTGQPDAPLPAVASIDLVADDLIPDPDWAVVLE